MPRYVALLRGINIGRRNRVAVVVLSRDELAQVIADNPFPDEVSFRCLHAVFRRHAMSPAGITAVADAQQRAAAKGSRDEAVVAGRVLFMRTPAEVGLIREEPDGDSLPQSG